MSCLRHARIPLVKLGESSTGSSRVIRRRTQHTQPRKADLDVSNQLREVMRNVPQPVAVAVTRVPADATSHSRYHGTTLSSFTSLTLHPHPLVAFSVRLPSRMADYLRPPPKPHQLPQALQQLASNLPQSPFPIPPPSFPLPRPAQDLYASIARLLSPGPSSASDAGPHSPELTVSLLSKSNEPIARAFSAAQADQSATFALKDTWDTTDPPALQNSIGRLRCEVVTSIPLRDVCGSGTPGLEGETGDTMGSHPGSELFICRVLAVESGEQDGGEPMLYWRHKYVGLQED